VLYPSLSLLLPNVISLLAAAAKIELVVESGKQGKLFRLIQM
jgi:hypothetical protein